jgi:hypothetical protein
MAVRLSALHICRFLPPGKFLVLISVIVCVNPRAIVRLEGLGKLKKSTSSRTRTGDLPACSIIPGHNHCINHYKKLINHIGYMEVDLTAPDYLRGTVLRHRSDF